MATTPRTASGAAQDAKQKHPAMLFSALATSRTAPLLGACMLPQPASSLPVGGPPGTAPLYVLPPGTSFELTPNQTVPSVLPPSRLSLRQILVRHLLRSDPSKRLPPPTATRLNSPAAACLMRHWVQTEPRHQVRACLMRRHSRPRHTASKLQLPWDCRNSRLVLQGRCIRRLPLG